MPSYRPEGGDHGTWAAVGHAVDVRHVARLILRGLWTDSGDDRPEPFNAHIETFQPV
ncbi:hypothetical protein [Roseobacter cerasinus]|uniref:hypothetical protein n=1 Tax=Roseobacter cerasinus TaxID=2602289 RepID=UPI00135946CC|nr:hypothetical protein [Roseobacter cerasinus]